MNAVISIGNLIFEVKIAFTLAAKILPLLILKADTVTATVRSILSLVEFPVCENIIRRLTFVERCDNLAEFCRDGCATPAGIAATFRSVLERSSDSESSCEEAQLQRSCAAVLGVAMALQPHSSNVLRPSKVLDRHLSESERAMWSYAAGACRNAATWNAATEYYRALAVFCPLLECVVRRAAQMCDPIVSSLLSDVILSAAFAQATSAPWLVRLLYTTVGSPRGLNLRNLVMHGFLILPSLRACTAPPSNAAIRYQSFPLLIAAVIQTVASVVDAQQQRRQHQQTEERICCAVGLPSSATESNFSLPLPTRTHLFSLELYPELEEPAAAHSSTGSISWEADVGNMEREQARDSQFVSPLYASLASELVSEIHLFALQRDADEHGGDFEATALLAQKRINAWCSMLALFPVIEHSLRVLFVEQNAQTTAATLPNGDDVTLALLAQDQSLYYILEDILSPTLVPAKGPVEAADYLCGRIENKLGSVLTGYIHAAWYNILISQYGWTVRDVIAHTKVDPKVLTPQIASYLLSLLDETRIFLSGQSHVASIKNQQQRVFSMRFLPQNVACIAMFDLLVAYGRWESLEFQDIYTLAAVWCQNENSERCEVEVATPFFDDVKNGTTPPERTLDDAQFSQVFNCCSCLEFVRKMEISPWPLTCAAPHEVTRQASHFLIQCLDVLFTEFHRRWEAIQKRTARSTHRRTFRSLVAVLPQLLERFRELIAQFFFAYKRSHKCREEHLWIVEGVFPFSQLAVRIMTEKHCPTLLMSKLAQLLQRHVKVLQQATHTQ